MQSLWLVDYNEWKKKGWGPRARCWAIFQLTELTIKANSPCFKCARARAHANDALNYAQYGCATQMWGITLKTIYGDLFVAEATYHLKVVIEADRIIVLAVYQHPS